MQERAPQTTRGATVTTAPAPSADPEAHVRPDARRQEGEPFGGVAQYLRKMRNVPATPAQHNPRTIYSILAIGFLILLILIWLIGSVAKEKINEISLKAGEEYDEYNKRENLAQDIRLAASNVIVESRLFAAKRNFRISPRPYGVNYEQAKKRLTEKFGEGKRLWGDSNLKTSFSPAEISAWEKVAASHENFKTSLIEVEQAVKSSGFTPTTQMAKDLLMQADIAGALTSPAGPAATPEPQPTVPPGVPVVYTGVRSELERAALDLAGAVAMARNETRKKYDEKQRNAAGEVGNTRWITFLVGMVIAIIAIALSHNQLGAIRRTTRRAVEAEGRERSVTDSQRNFIVVINEKGELLRANQAFHDYSRTSQEEMTLQDYRAVFAHMPEVTAFIWNTLQQPDTNAEYRERFEVKPRNFLKGSAKNADTRLFDVRITPLRIEGKPQGRVIVIDDITDTEKQREEIRRNRTLSAVGTVTAQVAHELYNPIGAVKLNLELLDMQVKEEEDVKHTVGRLKRGVEHLSTIVMDLRYLTKPREPERNATDINKLLDEVVELANDRLERARIRIVRDYSIPVPEGGFDKLQLRKVFLNLLINAVEASPQNGEIKLRTRFLPRTTDSLHPKLDKMRGALAVSIIDHGAGMSPETKRRLFEAFYTTKKNGTGLGMMITQEIIKKHGGKIEVESEEGKGTTVNV
ncbi:MAG: two-component system sensor histidine kinase NtrB, partial [Blastocatellia bacterium]